MQNIKYNNIIIKIINVYKINKSIKDKQVNMLFNNNNALKVLVCKQLLKVYINYNNMFSKVNLNILSSHKSDINYKIILEKNNNLLSSSFYSMSLK